MLHAFATLLAAAEAVEEEKSKAPFYIVGSLFGLWAIVLFAVGQKSETFPSSKGQGIALGAVSVAFALASGGLIVYLG